MGNEPNICCDNSHEEVTWFPAQPVTSRLPEEKLVREKKETSTLPVQSTIQSHSKERKNKIWAAQ
jgi:hypothetical protein